MISQILLRRILGTLEQHQPGEQAGLRAGFSTVDHIQVVSQLQEKGNEYKIHSILQTTRRPSTPLSLDRSSRHRKMIKELRHISQS